MLLQHLVLPGSQLLHDRGLVDPLPLIAGIALAGRDATGAEPLTVVATRHRVIVVRLGSRPTPHPASRTWRTRSRPRAIALLVRPRLAHRAGTSHGWLLPRSRAWVSRGNGLGGEGPSGRSRACRVARLRWLLAGRLIESVAARHRGRCRRRPGRRRGGWDAPTGNARRPSGDLYLPPDPRAALLLIPGVTPEGRDDSRLVAFAGALARHGFLVFATSFPGLRAQRVGRDDPDAIAAAGEALASCYSPAAAALRGRRHLLRGGARRHRGHDAARR